LGGFPEQFSGGLGMNTSLMDAHNLAVKLALVQNSYAKPEILSTYSLERREVAMKLVKMDAEMIRIYAEHGKSLKPEDTSKLIAFQHEHYAYQAGTNITYQESALVDSVPHSPSVMAKLIGGEGLIVGRRLLPATVKRYSDGKPTKILDAVPFDGRFTVFLCFGDLTIPGKAENLEGLTRILHRPNGIWECLQTKCSGSGMEPLMRIIGVTTASHLSPEFSALVYSHLKLRVASNAAAEISHPTLFDTRSLYTDDIPCLSPYKSYAVPSPFPTTTSIDPATVHAAAGILLHPLHQKWDVNPETGAIVVVRPDGHVGTLAPSANADGWMVVERYFRKFIVL
jgi:phenol 2-monooxygenase